MKNGTIRQRARERHAKNALRWQRHLERQRDLNNKIKAAASDILQSPQFRSTRRHIQHGNVTVNNHCLNVAKYSLAISEKLHISCSREELIRGALLHDYFLYDWHSREHVPIYKLHGFYHPGVALKNALEEYELTPRERDIIKKHMWPLTIMPPTCREAWIVTMADKWCSLLETFRIYKGHGVQRYDRDEQSVSTTA